MDKEYYGSKAGIGEVERESVVVREVMRLEKNVSENNALIGSLADRLTSVLESDNQKEATTGTPVQVLPNLPQSIKDQADKIARSNSLLNSIISRLSL